MRRILRDPIGTTLEELCAAAKERVLLVAPFIKRATLERVVEHLPASVPVHCVTRWIPEEIVAGVSDLEVWPLLRDRGNATLALRRDLHAKYYRADDSCLVGSANLTHAALGWRAGSNLELLLQVSLDDPAIVDFERQLAFALEVTEEIYREYERAVREIQALPTSMVVTGDQFEADAALPVVDTEIGMDSWLPTLRHPEHLFGAYAGDVDGLTTTSRADAARDLRAFHLPRGLSREAFKVHIRLQLLQMPIIRGIDALVSEPQRFGAVRDHLANQPCARRSDFDPSVAWQTLMRWLLLFAGDRYISWQANYSEIFWRRMP